MLYIITHGSGVARTAFPRRSAASALRAVQDLQLDEAIDIIVQGVDGRVIPIKDLIALARRDAQAA